MHRHYYPWMAEAFNLSVRTFSSPHVLHADDNQDRDQFTMLSGIAHDPIQRYVVPVMRSCSTVFENIANKTSETYLRLSFLVVRLFRPHFPDAC